jgi:5-methylcytosine-specific restriction enzyme A
MKRRRYNSAWWERDPRTWYGLQRWRRIRLAHLSAHPFCALCEAKGLIRAAIVVDHIEPHEGDWELFLAGELQSLCKPCHDSDKRYQDIRGYGRIACGADGWPLDEQDDVLPEQVAERKTKMNKQR